MKSRRKFHYIYDKFEEGREAYLFSETREESTAALCKMLHCARCGFPTIMREFGFFLQVAFDRQSAARLSDYYIHRAAEEGDAAATMELIEQYWWKDRATAMQWITRARRAGMYEALHNMATDLDEEDRELALYIYASIPQRQPHHSLIYGQFLITIDRPKATRIITKAIRDTEESHRCSHIVELCNSSSTELAALGRKLLLRQGHMGCREAQKQLGHRYYHGKSGFEQNLRKAFHWWKKAADNGCHYSMQELALMYEHAEGIRCNKKKAFYYTKAAAEGGSPRAITNLGYCYYWGIGTRRDISASIGCFRHAIEQGDTTIAAHNLAEQYYKGNGIEKNYAEAIRYHQMAAQQNYPDSIARLGYMHLHGEGFAQDIKQGLHLIRKAMNLGSSRALCYLAKCYEYGMGVKKDWYTAIMLYTQAAEKGDRYTRPEIARLKRKLQGLETRSN